MMRKFSPYLALISIILSFIAVVFLVYENSAKDFSWESFLNIIGVSVTCLSLVIALYFIVLAVDAYGTIKEIQEVEKSAGNVKKEIEEFHEKAKRVNGAQIWIATKSISDNIEIMCQYFMDLNRQMGTYPFEDSVSQFYLQKGRLGILLLSTHINFNEEQVNFIVNCIHKLSQFGDKNDHNRLIAIHEDFDSNQTIKDLLGNIIENLPKNPSSPLQG